MEIGYKKSQCIENNIAQNGVKSTVLRKTKKNLKKMKKSVAFLRTILYNKSRVKESAKQI